MTEEEFLMKVAEMMPDLTSFVMDKAHTLIKSGAINFEEWENNWRLPKIFMQAMGREITAQYKTSDRDRIVANNITHVL